MDGFKPLDTKKYIKEGHSVTPYTTYWNKLSVPTLVKEFGDIDYIDFSPIEPHYFAVTCSVRVQIYNPVTKLVVKNLSRFQETAYGGTFRQDGRLLVAGDEQGFVKLFDTSSKNILRLFKGHSDPVHRVKFTCDMLRIASFSDDRSVKLWDISNEQALQTFSEHDDYVRAGAVNPVSADVIISGGYDGKIKMYDTRSNQVVMSSDHGKAVETLVFLPTGGIFLSAGGTDVRVWDICAGCRLVAKLSQHHKTVTCLHLGSNGKSILSGGLDRHVKVYDVANYQTVHTLNFPNAVLSLGVSPNDQTVAAGMAGGLISIQNMESSKKTETTTRSRRIVDSSDKGANVQVDYEITIEKSRQEKTYNRYLRNYEYAKCLDSVLQFGVNSKYPNLTVSILQELIRRKGLHRALVCVAPMSLIGLVTFINRYIGECRFMRVLIDTGMILLDVFEDRLHELDSEMAQKFVKLSEVTKCETALSYDLLELQGMLDMLMAASHVSNSPEDLVHFIKDKNSANLKQSNLAKEGSILTV